MNYCVGTSGWNYKHWKKRFYPQDIKQKEWLDFYSKKFSTVEVNYSFYNWPKVKTLKKWRNQTPGEFKFTLKVPRFITHYKKLKNIDQDVQKLYRLTSNLEQKLGCHLFQLPPSFHKEEETVERLKHLLKIMDARKNNAIEFRHKSWWEDETFDLLDEYGIGFCTVIGLGMPDNVVVTGNIVYFRFHGEHYDTLYSESEINEFAKTLKNIKGKNCYAYFNNDANAYAPRNALQLKDKLEV
ncbi:MAG: DUF72 domain-containing protein [Candidatus Cloacimonetes bacterium]|nr:DUF72 domain-containing protein [Candidatus Cloacimonadota bacterium]